MLSGAETMSISDRGFTKKASLEFRPAGSNLPSKLTVTPRASSVPS